MEGGKALGGDAGGGKALNGVALRNARCRKALGGVALRNLTSQRLSYSGPCNRKQLTFLSRLITDDSTKIRRDAKKKVAFNTKDCIVAKSKLRRKLIT